MLLARQTCSATFTLLNAGKLLRFVRMRKKNGMETQISEAASKVLGDPGSSVEDGVVISTL